LKWGGGGGGSKQMSVGCKHAQSTNLH